MSARSIKLRLAVAAGATLVVAMIVVASLLVWLFERHVRNHLGEELGHHLNQLAALLIWSSDGPVLDGEMVDPRFDKPLGGLYWQVDQTGRTVLRSRSLWDEPLRLEHRTERSNPALETLSGPGGRLLLGRLRTVSLGPQSTTLSLVVAIDADNLILARGRLVKPLSLGLLAVLLALLIAAWLQIQYGLRPLDEMRGAIERIRSGADRAIDTAALPDEVQPLVREINDLIAAQNAATERARAHSGNLAHGLKTPLAAVAAEADRLRRVGVPDAPEHLELHVASMQRHIERHLAFARSHGGRSYIASGSVHIGERIAETMATLRRLPSDRSISWRLTGDVDTVVRIDGEDLDEICGNLLDNARKWARSRIDVRVALLGDQICVHIADDGDGVSDDKLEVIRQRGVRLDQRVPGAGLGLAIVDAILETYGSKLRLARASIGGMEAVFTLHGGRSSAA